MCVKIGELHEKLSREDIWTPIFLLLDDWVMWQGVLSCFVLSFNPSQLDYIFTEFWMKKCEKSEVYSHFLCRLSYCKKILLLFVSWFMLWKLFFHSHVYKKSRSYCRWIYSSSSLSLLSKSFLTKQNLPVFAIPNFYHSDFVPDKEIALSKTSALPHLNV